MSAYEDDPQTPEASKIRHFPLDRTPNGSNLTPPGSPMYQVKYKDYQSAIEAIQQLELELVEFQTSSYELEKELEQELTALENENFGLKEKNLELNEEVKALQSRKFELEKLSNQKSVELNERIQKLNHEIQEKNTKLVDIEILNDNIEQNERNLSIIYKELEERYNSSSEQLIIVETELSDLKDDYLKEQLNHQNTKNELNDWKSKYEDLLKKQIEQTETKTHSRKSTMTKSNSLIQLHTMIASTKDMESRIGNIKSSLNNKSLKFSKRAVPTTKLSNTTITTSTPSTHLPTRQRSSSSSSTSTHKKLPLSPSSLTLSSLVANPTTSRIITLEKIEGSPNKEPLPDKAKTKKGFSFGGILREK